MADDQKFLKRSSSQPGIGFGRNASRMSSRDLCLTPLWMISTDTLAGQFPCEQAHLELEKDALLATPLSVDPELNCFKRTTPQQQ
jgi:hypothetical protein